MTYQVMLADDENDVLEVIQKKIDWNALGLEEPVKASNGVEALELAEKVQPDIVMTDIKMPYMDGLELARQLRQLYPDIRIIILSGFDEFEYAKEAVHLNAVEYLLKPIDSEYLTAVFRKITASLDQEHEERQNQKILQQYYQQSPCQFPTRHGYSLPESSSCRLGWHGNTPPHHQSVSPTP